MGGAVVEANSHVRQPRGA